MSSSKIKIVDPFTNIELTPITSVDESGDATYLSNLQAINIGDGGSNVFRADKSGIWLGAAKFADAIFSVSMSGAVVASSITLSGYVAVGGAAADVNAGATTISGGKITAYSIAADRIVAGALVVGTNVGLGTAQDSAGVTTIIGNTVTTGFVNALNITAQYVAASISISSPTITGGSIAIGSGNSIFKADSNGIYLGNATFASAPFRVTMAGAVTASNLTLTNASIGSGSSYTGNAINESYIGNLNASKITAGTIDASVITVSNLNASNITTGTLSGRTVQSSSGNERIVLDTGDYLKFYTGGTLRASIRGVYGSSAYKGIVCDADIVVNNNRSFWIKSSADGTNDLGGISITSGNQFWLTLGTDNSFYVKNNAQTANYLTISSSKVYIGADYLLLKTLSSNPTTDTGGIWHYSSGGTDQFRGEPSTGWNGSFDMTAV